MKLTVQVIATSQWVNFKEDSFIKLVGSFNNREEALEFTALKKPSIILLEYEAEKLNTELFVKSLLIESPDSRIIMLGQNLSDEIILSCLISAIYGYLERQDVNTFLQKAIFSVGKGEAWVSRRLVGLLIEKLRH